MFEAKVVSPSFEMKILHKQRILFNQQKDETVTFLAATINQFIQILWSQAELFLSALNDCARASVPST